MNTKYKPEEHRIMNEKTHKTHSMTAFTRKAIKGDWGDMVWEIRSINHRFLDISMRLPELFRHMEGDLRASVKKHLSRGKVDITLNYQPGPALVTGIVINKPLVEQLAAACKEVEHYLGDTHPIDPLKLLKWPGVTRFEEANLEHVEETLVKALDDALIQLIEGRAREGTALKTVILERVAAVEAEIAKVVEFIPMISQALRNKLTERLKEIDINIDQNRLEQEIVIHLQKIDVAEEIDRLNTHIVEVKNVVENGGVIGRRLDFLMQELLREANTLGSKSTESKVTSSVVELKVLIEQMREQVQNIE